MPLKRRSRIAVPRRIAMRLDVSYKWDVEGSQRVAEI